MKWVMIIGLFPLLAWSQTRERQLIEAAKETQENKSLTVEQVFESISKYHPSILMTFDQIKMTEGKVMKNRGSFDMKLKYKHKNRADGYYSGEFNDLSVNQPIGLMNGELFAGVRNSAGEFPVYEGEYATLSEGEQYVGIRLSLLRDMWVDSRRLGLRNAIIQNEMAKHQQDAEMNNIFYMGEMSYWASVREAGKLLVFEDLLNVSQKRQEALRRRVRRGDVARIYLDENNQYILKRKAEVIGARQELINSLQKLSLFVRDGEGKPTIADKSWLPKTLFIHNRDISYNLQSPELVLDSLPGLSLLNREIEKIDNNIVFEKNNILPELDLVATHSEDRGDGPKTLEGPDFKIGVNFSFPLWMRKARGELRANQAKKSMLITKRSFFVDKVRVKYTQLQTKQEALKKKLELLEEEITIAIKLRDAEEQKFMSGGSDFFVINLREQNILNAKIKYIDSVYKYHNVVAKLKNLTNNFRQF